MNRFSALAKLADSMLTTPDLLWTATPKPATPAPPAPAGPLSNWLWGPAPLGD